ncbi:hypothetical protein Tco_1270413 [Tanacetum coccineum]
MTSMPSGTRTDSSHSLASSDSTAPWSPDHLLTHVSPTPAPTRASFHHRITCMTVRAQLAMSPGLSASITEAMALDSAFCKRYRSSYETPSSSRLWLFQYGRGIEDESLDADDERERLDDEDHGLDDEDRGLDDEDRGLDDEDRGLDDEDHGLDDEDRGLDDEGLGLEEEEEAAPEVQRQAVSVADTTASEPLGLGYGAARRRALELIEEIAPSTYEVDPEDDRVYTDIPVYPTVAPVQTPTSSDGGVLCSLLFQRLPYIDRDVRELYIRSGVVVKNEISRKAGGWSGGRRQVDTPVLARYISRDKSMGYDHRLNS